MSVLDLLKPSKPAEEIRDESLIKKTYKYWRFRTFYGMYVGYVFYYITRKSFTFAMPVLMKDLHFDKTDMGILGTIFSVTYGASKFLSGIQSDESNPRYFMGIGLMLTGVFNIFFGLSSSILFFALFWGMNGWFQGWGWPPCAKLLTHWYSQSERGRWWSVWNTAHNLGGAIITVLASSIAGYLGWRYSLYIPGILCIFVGLFIINRLRDTPQSLGLPPIEKFRNDYPSEKHEDKEKLTLTAKEILFQYVLNNKFIWVLAIAYFFIYVIRMAVNDWTLLFLVEHKGYSMTGAGVATCLFEVGGFFGSLAAGWGSDYLFKAKRGPVNVLFTILAIAAVFALWKSPIGMPILDSCLIFATGFAIFGPQMLIGMAAAELSHKKAAGTATGFVGNFAYLGAAATGFPLGWVSQHLGWEGFFIVLAICGFVALACLAPLWNVKTNPKMVQ